MAKLFASEGAKIAVIEMHQGRGQSVVDETNKVGHEAMLVLCDVAKSSDVKEMVSKVTDRFGGIDILVNNAALTDHANIFDSTEEEFDKVIEVSLKGPYLVTKYVAQQMRDQGRGGKIVNFGSTSGMVGRFDGIAYAARLLHRAMSDLGGEEPALIELGATGAEPVTLRTRMQFLARLARLQSLRRVNWLLFTHVGIARAQLRVPKQWRRPYAVMLHGIEAWDPALDRERLAAMHAARVRIAISPHTARRVAATHPQLPPVESVP
jgi:NAD(P)-dependent dehydrogenase (short-subunit alcohol dehydrogenase family)